MGALEISGLPQITLVPLHNLYAGDPDVIDRIGAVSFRERSQPGLVDVLRRRGLQTAPPERSQTARDRPVGEQGETRIAFGPVGLAGCASCFSAFSSVSDSSRC